MTTQVPDQSSNDELFDSLATSIVDKLNMDEYVLITVPEFREHIKRVETLVNLLERLGEAIATSPYAAMLPADLVNDLRGK